MLFFVLFRFYYIFVSQPSEGEFTKDSRKRTNKMTSKFYLKDPSAKKPTPIILSISHGGKLYQKYIGRSVNPRDFKKQRVKDEEINGYLRQIENRLNERLNQFSTPAEIKRAITYALGQEKEEEGEALPRNPSFWEYMKEWSERPSPSKRQHKLAYNNIKKFMGMDEDWEDIDERYHYRLVLKMKAAGFSKNYQWRTIQELRTVLNEGVRFKYRKDLSFRDWKNSRTDVYNIALTPEEISAIEAADLPTATLRTTRDLFLVGYYTGARFSDYSRLSLDNAHDGKIEFVQEKTGGRVILPLSTKLKAILERYEGRAPRQCQQVFNRQIKDVARLAGVDGIVELPKDQRKPDGAPTYRWEMVTSHTSRRSCATNLYLAGVPPKDICYITGHKDIRTLEMYIKVTTEMAVGRLSELEFFK